MYIFVEEPKGISFDVYDKFEKKLMTWEELTSGVEVEKLIIEGVLNETRYEIRNLKIDNNTQGGGS